jgi:hypothetical protein
VFQIQIAWKMWIQIQIQLYASKFPEQKAKALFLFYIHIYMYVFFICIYKYKCVCVYVCIYIHIHREKDTAQLGKYVGNRQYRVQFCCLMTIFLKEPLNIFLWSGSGSWIRICTDIFSWIQIRTQFRKKQSRSGTLMKTIYHIGMMQASFSSEDDNFDHCY